MEVRRATNADMKEMVDYLEEYHKTSNVSDIPFNRTSLVKVLDYYIVAGDSIGLIAKENDTILGLLFGSLEPFFFNSKKSYATDLLYIANGAGPQLWKAFKKWAFGVGADRIIMGVSSGDDRACHLLEIMGMESTGGMYVLRQESS